MHRTGRRQDTHDSRRVIYAIGVFVVGTFIATLAFHQVRTRVGWIYVFSV